MGGGHQLGRISVKTVLLCKGRRGGSVRVEYIYIYIYNLTRVLTSDLERRKYRSHSSIFLVSLEIRFEKKRCGTRDTCLAERWYMRANRNGHSSASQLEGGGHNSALSPSSRTNAFPGKVVTDSTLVSWRENSSSSPTSSIPLQSSICTIPIARHLGVRYFRRGGSPVRND